MKWVEPLDVESNSNLYLMSRNHDLLAILFSGKKPRLITFEANNVYRISSIENESVDFKFLRCIKHHLGGAMIAIAYLRTSA